MIEIIKQDRYNGEILDTQIKVKFKIAITGKEYQQFKKELEELISKYSI